MCDSQSADIESRNESAGTGTGSVTFRRSEECHLRVPTLEEANDSGADQSDVRSGFSKWRAIAESFSRDALCFEDFDEANVRDGQRHPNKTSELRKYQQQK